MTTTELIPLDNVNAALVFADGKSLDALLEKIETYALSFAADISTDKGRKEVASRAYNIARSKTALDEAGKKLVEGWKKQAKAVDDERKRARDRLDALKDKVRQPLTDWEAEQERIAEEAREAERRRQEEAERARIAELERREAEIAVKEEAIRKAKEEASAKAEAERLAKERAEREAAEAKEQARLAEERERVAAIKADNDRKEAAERAERDKQEAVRLAEERARKEAEAREMARQAEESARAEEEKRRAANREHRAKINNAVMAALTAEGIGETTAKKVITLIASGSIPHVSIIY